MHGSIGSLKTAYLRPCLKYEQNSQKKITQNPNNLPPPIIKKHISRRISSSRIERIGQVREELGFRTEEEVQTREKRSAGLSKRLQRERRTWGRALQPHGWRFENQETAPSVQAQKDSAGNIITWRFADCSRIVRDSPSLLSSHPFSILPLPMLPF